MAASVSMTVRLELWRGTEDVAYAEVHAFGHFPDAILKNNSGERKKDWSISRVHKYQEKMLAVVFSLKSVVKRIRSLGNRIRFMFLVVLVILLLLG